MAECMTCESDRLLIVSGKVSDRCYLEMKNDGMSGYVPDDMGIGGGDYLEFTFCLECGQIQDIFPVDDLVFEESDEDE